MKASFVGPEPPPGLSLPTEHLPTKLAITLSGHHDGPVLAVRFNSSGSYCLSCGRDRTVKLWNPHKGTCIKSYAGHGYDVRDADVTRDNSKFASCGGDRQVFLWDVSTGHIIRKFRGHNGPINSLIFSNNNDILVTGGYDQTVSVWDCRSRSIDAIQSMKPFKDSVSSVTMPQDGGDGDNISSSNIIIAGSIDGTIRQFDIRAGELTTDTTTIPITTVATTSDGKLIAAACLDDSIRLLDAPQGILLNKYTGGHSAASCKMECCFTPEEEGYIVAASEDGRVCYYDVVDAQVVESFQAHPGTVCSVAMHPDGSMLLTSSVDGSINVWH
jgi:mitogen-activated protein kinase organizer 1